ncbi:hypothetical protein [Hymenobacter sp. IS2118]|uniref:hypothetical protein n=1 Tax=Hymenobacter sp. IS2118 TaxID=1505605 RepID=UPI00054D5D99|nr:hypothetical protein [Hymenobacter sp. IS2118]
MAIDPNNRPVRVINDDTTNEEMEAGHHIPNADPPKNEAARGGFGNRDGKQGFGTDSEDGITAVSVNSDADQVGHPKDNMRTSDEGRPNGPNQDGPDDEDEAALRPVGPVDELDAHDRRPGLDEMRNPNSRVGMGQMEPRPLPPITGTDTNAELNDPDATDTAIDQ